MYSKNFLYLFNDGLFVRMFYATYDKKDIEKKLQFTFTFTLD